MDDRRTKSELDERERMLREARVAAAAAGRESAGGAQSQQQVQVVVDEPTSAPIPGSGRTLRGSPPPYTDKDEDD